MSGSEPPTIASYRAFAGRLSKTLEMYSSGGISGSKAVDIGETSSMRSEALPVTATRNSKVSGLLTVKSRRMDNGASWS
jgi:hypothetical protein